MRTTAARITRKMSAIFLLIEFILIYRRRQ
jgi:hypothetical protein